MKSLQSSSELNNANSRPASVAGRVSNSLASNPTTRAKQVHKSDNSGGLKIQKKLTIGKPNDKYEQEADRVADQVVSQSPAPKVQKKCAACTNEEKPGLQKVEEEEVQAKPISLIQRQIPEELQAKTEDSTNQEASGDVTSQINASRGSGSPMPSPIQQSMESGIGADFSRVRIHTDSRAQNLSAQLNAQAFTVGNDVFFNKGKYNPESQAGKHLLAHELTHTVQQGAVGPIQKKSANELPKITHSNPGIQRLVFFGKEHIPAQSTELKNDKAKKLASDNLVRSFENHDELDRYASGDTDYLGNLTQPKNNAYDGVWVRFAKTGTNIIGEDHSKVTLSDCIRATGGSNSFIRERFNNADLSAFPTLKKEYEEVNKDEFQEMGILEEKEKQKFGLEPIFPKLGQAMSKLSHALINPGVYYSYSAVNKSDLGKRLSYFTKLAWSYTTDLVNTWISEKGGTTSNTALALWRTYNAGISEVQNFVNTIDNKAYLTDQIDKTPNSSNLKKLLQAFAEAFTLYSYESFDIGAGRTYLNMFSEGVINTVSGQSLLDSKSLTPGGVKVESRVERQLEGERSSLFNKKREGYMKESTLEGIKKGVRYIGMGAAHFHHLKEDIDESNTKWYDMADKNLEGFKRYTSALRGNIKTDDFNPLLIRESP